MKKISQAGLYAIDMETYHSDCCDGPSISSSGLGTLLLECPAIYWGNSYLNPNREPEKPSRALEVGRAAHALVLGEPEFDKHFVVCPHEKLNANPGKQWNDEWKAKVEAGIETRTLIRAAEFEMIREMAAAQLRSPQVARAFRDGKPEQSLIWKDDETGVYLKSRPDWLPDDPAGGWVLDYKAMRSILPRKFSADAFEYGYHLQAALQVDGVRAIFGVDPLGIAHVAQEKTPPYLAELRLFTPEQIDFGRREYRRALRRFADCWALHAGGKAERQAWPGYSDEPQYIETPFYIAKQMMESETNGTEAADRRRGKERDPADYLSA